MFDKLSYTGTIFDTSRQDTVTPEKNRSARQCLHEDVRALLRNASVSMEFKQSVQGVLPDSRLSSFTSPGAFAGGDVSCPRVLSSEMKMCRSSADLSATSEKTTQPLHLTDAMVNLTLLEYVATGLQCFDAHPLSALITNTYFLEPCFYPPIYWCPCAESLLFCKFDLSIELVKHKDGTILAPFKIPDFDELNSATSNTRDFVKFEIKIEENPVDYVLFQVTVGSGAELQSIYSELAIVGSKLRTVGTHEWKWDGFSDQGILDTKILKDPNLKLKVSAELCGKIKTATIDFDNKAKEQDWVDVVINKKSKDIEVELRVNIKDGGENGVGERPPRAVQAEHSLPATDPRLQPHVRIRSYTDLKNLVLSGLKKYWSRNAGNTLSISTKDGSYTVSLTANSTSENSMDDIDVEYNTNGEWGRSSNPGSVRGIFSFIANIFVPEQAIYNGGWIEYDKRGGGTTWVYNSPSTEDNHFSETAAHEVGHEILSAYGGENYSYGHRNFSTVITQAKKPMTGGGVSYPLSGEIDLMKYYNGPRPRNFFSRVVASEVDVKSLLWLARIEFDD
jgi:hypothetical protein